MHVAKGTNEGSIEALKNLPDDPEAVFQEGLAAAKDQPGNLLDKVGVRFESEKVLVVECSDAACNSVNSMRTLPHAESAIDFLQKNPTWHAPGGTYSNSGMVLYPSATSSTYFPYSEGMGPVYLRALNNLGPRGTNLSGVENVVRVLAHETGHHLGYSHNSQMWNREYEAIKFYRSNGR